MQKISRQKTVEGTRVPGIIKNFQYFYINVDVYEDGMVNCWELVDLDGLKEKLSINWLLPQVPVGENISIHGLGCYKIKSAIWRYDSKSYYKYINNIIKKLNPKLTNIYRISKEEKKLLEERKIKYSPEAREMYVNNNLFYKTIDGKGLTIFINHNGRNHLVNLVVYKDGKVSCYNSEFEIDYKLEDMKELFNNGTFFTSFNNPTSIVLDSLGEVVLSEILFSADINEKYKELIDNYERLNGNETSLEKCRDAYHEYLEYPTEDGRARLRELYELVPKHERMYLGDMDSRDTDYVRIIYRPNEKREV